MRAKGIATATGSSALLMCLLASAAFAQERARQRAPSIRVYSENGAGVVSSYVRPAIHVSEDAYVFAVMMDLDGHIQVLHPDFPGISVRGPIAEAAPLAEFLCRVQWPDVWQGLFTGQL